MGSSTTSERGNHPVSRMIQVGVVSAPKAPFNLSECGIDREILTGLALKLAHTVQHFTTEWMIQQLCLPQVIVMELLEELREEKHVEVLGEAGAFSYMFSISKLGRERAARLLEISGYVGPAPISLEAYTQNLDTQLKQFPEISTDKIKAAFSDLVLSNEAKQVVGLSLMSGRSLLVHGPPGSGKSSVGMILHKTFSGLIWIPHAVAIGNSIIRFFDPQCHTPAPPEFSHDEALQVDQRWLRIERPFIVVGGELTMERLDLGFDPTLRFYEAPLHWKANGGTFLLDDFGRQRVEPSELLNRWIIPLERQVDYLTLKSGQKVLVPIRQTLCISTSLDPDKVVDPAFMRRIGYRLYLGYPSPEQYTEIFKRYASRYVDSLPSGLIERMIGRYTAEDRPLRCSEPGELIERARDICLYRNQAMELNAEIMEHAWQGYFGDQDELH